MTQTLDLKGSALGGQAPVDVAVARPVKPVKWFAALGGLILVLEIYIYSAWISSGPTRTPNGPDRVPTFMAVTAHAEEIFFPTAAVFMFYWFLVRPWRREHRITLDGLFIIAFSLMWWQDPLVNYSSPFVTYNTVFWGTMGSWVSKVPGWMSPNGKAFVEPPFLDGVAYPVWVFGGAVLGCLLMRKAKARWPQLGTVGLLGVCFAGLALFDIITEVSMIRLGSFSYPGAIRWLSLFPGHYYQVPIYEFVLWPLAWTAFASARYFRNDKGQTLAERGLDQIHTSPRKKTVLRFLALTGIIQGSMLVFYCIPYAFVNLHNGAWPADFNHRSYLRSELCGAGTTYACPGSKIPVNSQSSWHISPQGTLVKSGQDR
jgi:hypothetical protein